MPDAFGVQDYDFCCICFTIIVIAFDYEVDVASWINDLWTLSPALYKVNFLWSLCSMVSSQQFKLYMFMLIGNQVKLKQVFLIST